MGSTKALADADWASIAQVTATCAVGIASLAVGFQGWALLKTTFVERSMFIVAGFALVYPGAVADFTGFGLVLVAMTVQFIRFKTSRSSI